MAGKRPVLSRRLEDAPLAETFLEDVFMADGESYRPRRGARTGREFVVLIPEGQLFDDSDVAYELGLDAPTSRAALISPAGSRPDCQAFGHLHFRGEACDAYLIPALRGPMSAPADRGEEADREVG